MMDEKTYMQKQRILLVNREFQLRYTGVAVLVGLLSTALTAVFILMPLYAFEILRVPRFLPTPVLLLIAIACLLNILLVAFMGVLLTHRIAGPMYSLVRQFRRVEEGQWCGQLKLRDEDELRYVVRNFNAMMDAISKVTSQDLQKLESIREALKVKGEEAGDNYGTVEPLLLEIDELIARLKSRLS
jgi:signal transduction histidine kinase